MGEHLRKVQPGQALSIPAATFNTFVDAARDHQQRQRGVHQAGTPTRPDSGIVLVKNDSGYDRDRFNVLGIDGPVITPTDNADEFQNRVALSGSISYADSHTGLFVVLLETLAAGAIGRGVVAGVTVARVDVTDEDHAFAEVVEGECGHLASGDTGSARILWKETGTGVKWAVVRLADAATPGLQWGKATENWHNAAGNGCYVNVNPCDDRDGTNPDTSKTIKVYLPRCGSTEDPNVVVNAVVPHIVYANGDAVCVGDYLDGTIGKSVQIWEGDPADLATDKPGWEVHTRLGAKFPAVYQASHADYGCLTHTGGFTWHGQTENNHGDHNLAHTHDLTAYACIYADLGGSMLGWAMLNQTGTTSGPTWSDPGGYNKHKGPYNSGADTDNRPPWGVVLLIVRTNNAAA